MGQVSEDEGDAMQELHYSEDKIEVINITSLAVATNKTDPLMANNKQMEIRLLLKDSEVGLQLYINFFLYLGI